jgi:hypothetical protein
MQFGLDHVEALRRGLQSVGQAVDFGHLGSRVLALGLALADLLAQRIAARLQFLGAALDRLALAFQRTESDNVEKGLRRLAAFEQGNGGGEVFAEEADVEHGVVWQRRSSGRGDCRGLCPSHRRARRRC